MIRMKTSVAELRRSCGIAFKGFVTFIICPTLDGVEEAEAVSKKVLTLWLLVFSFAATAIFALLALPLILYADAAPGKELRTVFDHSGISVFVTVVLLGPLVEEVIFRGWLTGTVRALMGSVIFLTIWFGGSWMLTNYLPQVPGLRGQLGLATAGLCIFLAVSPNTRENHAAWYRSAFPFVFWAQGLIFGGLHFANVSSAWPILPLLMTSPFVMCGWLWGYARITLGFGTAWMLHLAYNVPAAMGTMAIIALGSA